MRLFIGVWLSEAMKKEVVDYISRIQPECSGFKWTSPENLHFTLKFLGEISESGLKGLTEALKHAAAENGAFRLTLGTVGFFPPKGVPRIVWLDVGEGRAELVKLAESVEGYCLRQGFSKADKPFKAHLTIGRAKNEQSEFKLPKTTDAFKSETMVTGFSLIESRLFSTGPVYYPVENYSLEYKEKVLI